MHLPEVTFLAVLLWGMHVECLLRNIFAFHTFFSTSLWASSSFQGTEPDLTEIKLKPVNWLLNVFLVSLVTRSSSVLGSNASWLWRLAFFFFSFPSHYILLTVCYILLLSIVQSKNCWLPADAASFTITMSHVLWNAECLWLLEWH